MHGLLEIDEIYGHQRSRINWLKHGEKNTSFFHNHANYQAKHNLITGILDENKRGHRYEKVISNTSVGYFNGLFRTAGVPLHDEIFDAVHHKVLSNLHQGLNLPFTRHKIETAVKDIVPVKSPRPDGMLALFYQKYWNIVGDDVCNTCLSIPNGSGELGSLNETLIALIPKINLSNRVSEFCPISLCNVLYKIISKTPAMRMKKVLPHVISEY